jgi:putative ABC transport system permease protein
MNLIENFREGIRSIQANLLRSVLTALIVAIGIFSLVGSLTAVEAIEASVAESLSTLGVNTFDIYSRRNRQASQDGVKQKVYKPLQLNEAQKFIDRYQVPSRISLSASLSQIVEVKYKSKKTDPNIGVDGVNEDYMTIQSLEIDKGRNFSSIEIQFGTKVAVMGSKVAGKLFAKGEDPIRSTISFKGVQFRVIGILKEKGQLSEDNYDNMVFIPIIVANQMASGRGLDYYLKVGIDDMAQMDFAMGEATGLMRAIRQDQVGSENSFELVKSETLAENLASITNGLRIGGFGVGFVTLLGAAIALMNIMLVSVTERTREVGVRKALGATPLRIRQQFVMEAIVVCLLGGVGGIVLGIVIVNIVSLSLGVDAIVLPWLWMFVGLAVCVVVGLLSGYYPAFKASKLDPIESLRFE